MRPSLTFIKEHFPPTIQVVGLEVGVDQGLNAYDMLCSFDHLRMLYLVENGKNGWERICNGVNQLRPFGSRIQWYFKSSEEVAKTLKDNSFNFVYIDNGHSYDEVRRDMNVWYPKLTVGGVLAGHDYAVNDVKMAVDEWCKAKDVNLQVKLPDWWFVK